MKLNDFLTESEAKSISIEEMCVKFELLLKLLVKFHTDIEMHEKYKKLKKHKKELLK